MEYPQWISVKNKLPEKNELVIITHQEDKWVCAGQINNDKKWYNQWESKEQGDSDIIITHWMPLPDSPQE